MPKAPSVPHVEGPLAFAGLFPPAPRGWYTYDEWRGIARLAIDRGLFSKDDLSRESMNARAAAAEAKALRSYTTGGGLAYLLLLRLDAVAKAVHAGIDEREFGMKQVEQTHGPQVHAPRLL